DAGRMPARMDGSQPLEFEVGWQRPEPGDDFLVLATSFTHLLQEGLVLGSMLRGVGSKVLARGARVRRHERYSIEFVVAQYGQGLACLHHGLGDLYGLKLLRAAID